MNFHQAVLEIFEKWARYWIFLEMSLCPFLRNLHDAGRGLVFEAHEQREVRARIGFREVPLLRQVGYLCGH